MQISKDDLKKALHDLNSSLHQLEEVLKYLKTDAVTDQDMLIMQNSSISKLSNVQGKLQEIYLEEESKMGLR